MICHDKTIWHQVIAIKNRRNIQLADFFSVLKCLIHTYSAVISIFLVLIMNFPHSVSKRLILPWFALTPKIIIKCLSADLQRVAVRQYAFKNSMQSDEKYICVSAAQASCGIALTASKSHAKQPFAA